MEEGKGQWRSIRVARGVLGRVKEGKNGWMSVWVGEGSFVWVEEC